MFGPHDLNITNLGWGNFCYICGGFVIRRHQGNTVFVKNSILEWESAMPAHNVCYICVEDLSNWSKIEKMLRFVEHIV